MTDQNRSWYAGWAIVFLAFLMVLLSAGPIFISYSLYGQSFAREFGAPRTVVNLGFTAVLVISGLSSGLSGILIGKLGINRLAALGCIMAGSGLAVASTATSIWQVVFLFATAIALGQAFMSTVVSNALIASWFERRRGLAIGLSVMGTSVATIAYPPLTSELIQALGWRGILLFHGMSVVVLAPVLYLWARAPSAGIPITEQIRHQTGESASASRSLGTMALLLDRDFWSITFPIGTILGLNGAFMVAIIPFAADARVPQTDAALLVSTIGATALAGKLGFGVIADHLPLRPLLRAAVVSAFLAFVILLTSNAYGWWLISAAFFGLSLGGALPVWGAIMAQIYGRESYARALGWSRTAMTVRRQRQWHRFEVVI